MNLTFFALGIAVYISTHTVDGNVIRDGHTSIH